MAAVPQLPGFRARTPHGARRRGPGPRHGSTAGAGRCFPVSHGDQTFPCFKCGRPGDALDRRAQATRPTPYDAATDGGINDSDDYPIISGNPPTTTGINITFQVAPSIRNCDISVSQTPHWSGMLAALGDGSVRTLSPGMSMTTFWSAVTPAGGEVLGNDW